MSGLLKIPAPLKWAFRKLALGDSFGQAAKFLKTPFFSSLMERKILLD